MNCIERHQFSASFPIPQKNLDHCAGPDAVSWELDPVTRRRRLMRTATILFLVIRDLFGALAVDGRPDHERLGRLPANPLEHRPRRGKLTFLACIAQLSDGLLRMEARVF
jgi:hypothetical protein